MINLRVHGCFPDLETLKKELQDVIKHIELHQPENHPNYCSNYIDFDCWINSNVETPFDIINQFKLFTLLETMDVPDNRKDDYKWLNRNLGIRNSTHPNFELAKSLIKTLLNNEKTISKII